jgi:hypothetical protein
VGGVDAQLVDAGQDEEDQEKVRHAAKSGVAGAGGSWRREKQKGCLQKSGIRELSGGKM